MTSPLFPGLAAAVRFVAVGWRSSWAALLVASGVIALWLLAARSGSSPLAGLALGGLAILALTMAEAALLRSALARGGPAGLAGLRWGRPQTRLLAVRALTAVFLAILALLVFVVALCAAYAVASAGAGFVAADPSTWTPAADPRGRVVLGAVALAGGGLLVWAAVRLAFAPSATVARDRVQVLSAWPLTRAVPGALFAGLAVVGAGPAVVVAWLGRFARAAPNDAWAESAAFAAGLVAAGLWLPLSVGLMAYLFRRVEPASPPGPPPP